MLYILKQFKFLIIIFFIIISSVYAQTITIESTVPLNGASNVSVIANLDLTLSSEIIADAGDIIITNLTDSSFYVINASDTSRVDININLISINISELLLPNKNYSILISSNAFKNIDNIYFSGITNTTTWTFKTTSITNTLVSALVALKNHINNTETLTTEQIATQKTVIDARGVEMGNSLTNIQEAFNLITTYDSLNPPLFTTGSLTRSTETGNITWAIYRTMQAIMDYVYTSKNISIYEDILGQFSFGSSSNFPGPCVKASPTNEYTVLIDASFVRTFGYNTFHWTSKLARRPTGAYVAPGTIVTVLVPSTMVNSNFYIRVGSHSWDLSARPTLKRLDRSSLAFLITNQVMKVSNPLGGGIYIECPINSNAGITNITIIGAVRSPLYRQLDFVQTSSNDWINIERTNPAPWADFESSRFLMQVPRSWIYGLTNDVSKLMSDWDLSLYYIDKLFGFPEKRGKHSMYHQVDVDLRNSVYAPGYPMVNVVYIPTQNYGGNYQHWLLKGPVFSDNTQCFHELGHGYLFQKFVNEQETVVNLPYIAAMHQGFQMSLDRAFRKSSNYANTEYISDANFKDKVVKLWTTSFNFSPRHVAQVKEEKDYNHQGLGQYVDIANLFGWNALNNYWYYYCSNAMYGITFPSSTDDMLVRMCIAADRKDIRPLFHFWGRPPDKQTSLKNKLNAEGIQPSPAVYRQLVYYKSILLTNNTDFQTFNSNYFGRIPSFSLGDYVEKERARQWSTNILVDTNLQVRFPTEIYNEQAYTTVAARVQYLIDYYYPNGLPVNNDAYLTSLTIPTVVLTPSFSLTNYTYTGVVNYFTNSVRFAPIPREQDAIVKVNDELLNYLDVKSIVVGSGITTVDTVVVSSDMTTTNTYNVFLYREPYSPSANLSSLSVSAGELNPSFSNSISNYIVNASDNITNTIITAVTTQPDTIMLLNGEPFNSNIPSPSVFLSSGTNTFSLTVISGDLSLTNNFTIKILHNPYTAILTNLVNNSSLLSPSFSSNTFYYTSNVSGSTNTTIITPFSLNTVGLIMIGDYIVQSGQPSPSIQLFAGTNTITVIVISADLSITNTYTIDFNKTGDLFLYWDGGTNDLTGVGNSISGGGNGTWNTTIKNWDIGIGLSYANWSNELNAIANFGGSLGTINTSVPVTARELRFTIGGYILNGQSITLSSDNFGNIQISTGITTINCSIISDKITKTGNGQLSLTSTNYINKIDLSGGTLYIHRDFCAGFDVTNRNFTVLSSSTLTATNQTYNLNILEMNSGTLTIANGTSRVFNFATVTGASTIYHIGNGNGTLNLSNASQFYGEVKSGAGSASKGNIVFNSIGDTNKNLIFYPATHNGNAIINYNGNDDLILSNRCLEFGNNGTFSITGTLLGEGTGKLVLLQNVIASNSVSGTRTLELSGTSSTMNEIAGNIKNVTSGSMISLIKSSSGTWVLSNPTNSFSGSVTLEAGNLYITSLSNSGFPSSIGMGTGVISMASGGAFNLYYIGNGSTCNRRFSICVGGNLQIANNGTGPLIFTDSIFNNRAFMSGARNLRFGGNYSGINSIYGVIQSNTNASNIAQALNVIKQGTTIWAFYGANSYTGTTSIIAGNLRAQDGVGLPTTSSLSISNGVFETIGDLKRTGGTGMNQMNLISGSPAGFSAINSNAIVQFGSITPAALTWGSTSYFLPSILILNNENATHTLTFSNSINLNAAIRTIRVDTSIAIMSGDLTGTGSSGLNKTGDGILILTGSNTFAGNMIINSGTLQIGNGSTSGILTGMGVITNNSILIFNRSDSIVNSRTIVGSGNLIHTGTGTLTISSTNTYTGLTVVNNGILMANNINISTTPILLGNNGTYSGNFQLTSSQKIMAGSWTNNIGTNSFSGTVTLPSNSTNIIIKVDGQNNDLINFTTLVATNAIIDIRKVSIYTLGRKKIITYTSGAPTFSVIAPQSVDYVIALDTNTYGEIWLDIKNFEPLILSNGGLFSYLRMSDGLTNIIYDYSGYKNNGIINGTIIITNDAPFINSLTTSSLLFNEYSSIVISNTHAWQFGTDDFTIALWLKIDNFGSGNRNIISKQKWKLYLPNSYNFLNFRVNDVQVNSPTITDGFDIDWHHIVIVKKSSNIKLYLDGDLNSTVNNYESSNNYNDDGNIVIGGGNMRLYISNLMTYKRALTEKEIKVLSAGYMIGLPKIGKYRRNIQN